MIGFIDSPTRIAGTCPLDGNLMFYKNGELRADVSFTYAEDSCNQFIMKLGDKFIATKLSNKAVDLLKNLKEGKSFY
jgi:hypothetical protein